MIASDTYLQLVLDVSGGYKIHTDGRGRASFDSNLPRKSMPATGSKGAFSFDCKGLDEGAYFVAVQLLGPGSFILNGEGVLKILGPRSALLKSGGVLKIQVSIDTGPTIDVGEVTVPVPRH